MNLFKIILFISLFFSYGFQSKADQYTLDDYSYVADAYREKVWSMSTETADGDFVPLQSAVESFNTLLSQVHPRDQESYQHLVLYNQKILQQWNDFNTDKSLALGKDWVRASLLLRHACGLMSDIFREDFIRRFSIRTHMKVVLDKILSQITDEEVQKLDKVSEEIFNDHGQHKNTVDYNFIPDLYPQLVARAQLNLDPNEKIRVIGGEWPSIQIISKQDSEVGPLLINLSFQYRKNYQAYTVSICRGPSPEICDARARKSPYQSGFIQLNYFLSRNYEIDGGGCSSVSSIGDNEWEYNTLPNRFSDAHYNNPWENAKMD